MSETYKLIQYQDFSDFYPKYINIFFSPMYKRGKIIMICFVYKLEELFVKILEKTIHLLPHSSSMSNSIAFCLPVKKFSHDQIKHFRLPVPTCKNDLTYLNQRLPYPLTTKFRETIQPLIYISTQHKSLQKNEVQIWLEHYHAFNVALHKIIEQSQIPIFIEQSQIKKQKLLAPHCRQSSLSLSARIQDEGDLCFVLNMHFAKFDDSPMFRQQIQGLEEGAESLRGRCNKFFKGCRKYTEWLGEAYDEEIAFATALETFGGGHNDPIFSALGGHVMTKFTIALREIATYKEVFRKDKIKANFIPKRSESDSVL